MNTQRKPWRNDNLVEVETRAADDWSEIEITSEQFERAEAEVFGSDDQLLDDFAEWERRIYESASGMYVRMVRMIRDNSQEFRDWREQHHCDGIHKRAVAICRQDYQEQKEAA